MTMICILTQLAVVISQKQRLCTNSTVNTTPGFYVMAPNTNGKGFTSIMVNAGTHSISLDSRFFIDYGYFYMKGANNTGTVTLKIAR